MGYEAAVCDGLCTTLALWHVHEARERERGAEGPFTEVLVHWWREWLTPVTPVAGSHGQLCPWIRHTM